MTRPEAIEAAARGIDPFAFHRPTVVLDPRDEYESNDKHNRRLRAKSAANAAAPLIESALLDRIEEKVEGFRPSGVTVLNASQRFGYNAALDVVLAVLSEIRDGK